MMVPSFKIAVSVTGLKKLDRRIADLSEDIRKKVIRQAMNKALDIVYNRARRLAPDRSGRLVGSITKTVKYTPTEAVGSVYSAQRGKRGAPHAWLVHEGSKHRVADHTWVRKSRGVTFVTVRGQSFGRMPAQPFMRKAMEGKKMAVRKAFLEAIKRRLLKVSK